ncbi:hypothetical protein JI59_20745 (plasmid) [Novosphingobium pentaromativorans US6-1]|nr:hypothetical protein JI59_20745 [Novosphingobium pentaromativorans US6-1]
MTVSIASLKGSTHHLVTVSQTRTSLLFPLVKILLAFELWTKRRVQHLHAPGSILLVCGQWPPKPVARRNGLEGVLARREAQMLDLDISKLPIETHPSAPLCEPDNLALRFNEMVQT